MKDHQRAEFTNKLRSTAIKYQGTQQLRSRLAAVVDEYIPKDKNIETELDALQAKLDKIKQVSDFPAKTKEMAGYNSLIWKILEGQE